MGFVFAIGFIEHLQDVTTSNYNAMVNSHILQLQSAKSVLSLLYHLWLSPGNGFQIRSLPSFHVHVFIRRRLSHNSLIAPTNSQASDHLTQTSYFSHCRLRPLS
jgi:hypothetical protein